MTAANLVEKLLNESALERELAQIADSPEFNRWLGLLDDNGDRPLKPITTELLVSGFCEDLAVYLHYKYGAEVVHTDTPALPHNCGHYFVRMDGKYYDALSPSGANKPSEMKFFAGKADPEAVDKALSNTWNPTTFYAEKAKEFFKSTP
jgi:hypothetical protein